MLEPAITQIGGRYQLIDVIGKGGMGIVYRGFDVAMSRQVAIKMLHGFDAEDRETVLARFHREVTSLAALQHKNIVTIYTFEQYEGKPYMVMEYLEGKSLQEIIPSFDKIEMTEKLDLILQACDGLQYAHENGLIHRDIKPANILVLKNGVAKLIDFGIARAGLSETLTQPGQVVGSLPYMSPEHLSNHAVDARTDVYSAGVVLFQLLTGELPFQGADMASTVSQIINAPVPPLSTYIRDYPKELDQIVAHALAKKADDRYQSAEELGFDILKVVDGLKRGLTGELIRRAKACIERQDWEAARQQLQEVRKIDRRNDVANDLLQTVTREIQRQQKAAQIAQLRSQAQFALSQGQFEVALEYLEQGLRLDEGDTESLALREVVRERAKRAQDLDDALRRSQAAFYAGDLSEAQSAIDQALELDPEHTEAKTLGHLIKREAAERSKRVQLQAFVDAARAEIGKKHFLEALQFIQEAQEIDPSESSLQELLAWASRGHAQEKLRKELEKISGEIGQLLREDRYKEALAECDAALIRFPEEISLLKLRELAKRQFELQSRRLEVEEIGNNARIHANAGEYDKAVKLLEEGLATFPGDTNLEMLLAIKRAEVDLKLREEAERKEFLKRKQVQEAAVHSPLAEDPEIITLLQSFRGALIEKAPISSLLEARARLESLAATRKFSAANSAQQEALVADFEARQTKFNQDLAEIEGLRSAISAANLGAEMTRLLDRAKSLNDRYPKEERFAEIHQDILGLAHGFKQRRDGAAAELSNTVRSMQEIQGLAQLLPKEKQVQEAAKAWPDDPYIRSLISQASARVDDVRAHKRQVLEELAQVEETLAAARSFGQLRLMEEQARVLAADLLSDGDVEAAVRKMGQVAQTRLSLLNSACAALKDLTSKVANAETLEQADNYARAAERIASDEANFEEVEDLYRKVQRLIDERKKDYVRIERNLQLLIESSAKATGTAELDLILARRRDLVKKYPAEACFLKLHERLETSVQERRTKLAELAAAEQQADHPTEEADEEIYLGERDSHSGPIAAPVEAPRTLRSSTASLEIPKGGIPRKWILLAVGLSAAAFAGIFLVPKSVEIPIDPATASIQVDGQACETPCALRLMPGKHELLATSLGFDEIHQVVSVPWFGGELPQIAMKRTQLSSPAPTVAVVDTGTQLGGESKIIVNASQPGTSVFVDGRAAGMTSKDGGFEMVLNAGLHQVRVEKTGFLQNPPVNVRLDKDRAATIFFSLIQAPQPGLAKIGAGANASQPLAPTTTNPSVATTPVAHPQPTSEPTAQPLPTRPVPAPTDTFTITPETVEPGKSAQLAWATQNADEVTIDGEKVTPSGSKSVSATASRKFTLVAKGSGGTNRDEVFLNIKAEEFPKQQNNKSDSIPDQDKSAIQTILNRYAEVFAKRKAKSLKDIWPTAPASTLNRIQSAIDSSKNLNVSIVPQKWELHGTGILVTCQQALTFERDGKPMSQNATINFYMVKSQGAWIISDIPVSSD